MRNAVIAASVVAAVLFGAYWLLRDRPGDILLAYKFRPGQTNVYRAHLTYRVSAPAFRGSDVPPVSRQHGKLCQEILDVTPSATARVYFWGQPPRGSLAVASNLMPYDSYTVTMAKTGRIVSRRKKQPYFTYMGVDWNLKREPVCSLIFPDQRVRVGQRWTERVPFLMGGGDYVFIGKLVSDRVKYAGRIVCKIDYSFDGQVDLAELNKTIIYSDGKRKIRGAASVYGRGTAYFSRSEGRVIGATERHYTRSAAIAVSPPRGDAQPVIRLASELHTSMRLVAE